MKLTTLTFAYPGVPAERRAELAPAADAYQRLRDEGVEAFLLSTCLRVEVAVAGGDDLARSALQALYGRSPRPAEVRHEREAFLHLCRVAAGLESPVVGEVEVLGQFRAAVAAFAGTYPRSHPLRRVLDGAVAAARAARRRAGVSAHGSLAAVAAREAARHGRVAVFGAGAMARAAVEELADVEVAVFARRRLQVGGHHTRPWEEAFDALVDYPAVVSTVPGSEQPFPTDRVAAAIGARRRPLLLVDLGMPPGFICLPDNPHVQHLTIDAVATRAGGPPRPDYEAALTEEAEKAWSRIAAPDRARSVIAGLVDQAESAVDEEVSRFARRLQTTDDPEAVLRQAARTVARRLLHRPISYINSAPEAVEVLAEAFGVDR